MGLTMALLAVGFGGSGAFARTHCKPTDTRTRGQAPGAPGRGRRYMVVRAFIPLTFSAAPRDRWSERDGFIGLLLCG